MRKLSIFFVLSIILFPLTGCVAVDDKGNFKAAEIPVLHLLCNGNASVCAPGIAYVGLYSVMVDCEDYLAGIAPGEPLVDRFDVVGKAPTQNKGIYVEAFVSTFWNRSNQVVVELPATQHRVCAFIDMNSNGHWDYPEPRGEGLVTPGDRETLVDDWF